MSDIFVALSSDQPRYISGRGVPLEPYFYLREIPRAQTRALGFLLLFLFPLKTTVLSHKKTHRKRQTNPQGYCCSCCHFTSVRGWVNVSPSTRRAVDSPPSHRTSPCATGHVYFCKILPANYKQTNKLRKQEPEVLVWTATLRCCTPNSASKSQETLFGQPTLRLVQQLVYSRVTPLPLPRYSKSRHAIQPHDMLKSYNMQSHMLKSHITCKPPPRLRMKSKAGSLSPNAIKQRERETISVLC